MSNLGEKIRKKIVTAISDFRLIEPGDRVMVAVSGGKDSAVLLWLLEEIRRKAPFRFSLYPVILDQKQPGFEPAAYLGWFAERGLTIKMITEDTYSIVVDKVEPGKSYCGLCSRLRRGILYNYAYDNAYSKIALGHHRDDLNQTLLMNLFFVGRIAGMPAKLLSDDGRNTVIRPLCYAAEEDLAAYAKELGVPVIPCNLCGNQENLQRQEMKALLAKLEAKIPNISQSLLTAQKNIRMSQLLGNPEVVPSQFSEPLSQSFLH